MKLRHSARTDVGKTRDHNEDSYGIGETTNDIERLGELLIVCDGMGGHAAGEVASRMGVDTILSSYYGDENEDRAAVLEQAFELANAAIYEKGRGSMGTTGVAALLLHDALHVANVGDSRAYLVRAGTLRQISRDHSFVSDQVAAGLITAEQARSSSYRNVITRALGYQPGVTVDLFRWPLQVGDIIVLCSDGLHGLVSDEEIAQIVSDEPPDQAVNHLIELSNQRGGPDNITVVVTHIDALDWEAGPVEDPEDESAPHERVTVELPVSSDQPEDAAPPAPVTPPASAAPAAVIAPPPAHKVAPAAARTAAPVSRPVERRLTLLGGLLAALLLTFLIFTILIVLSQPPDTDTPAPTMPPIQTAAATAPAPTAAAPSAIPTAATPAAPTGTPAPTSTLAASATPVATATQ